MTEKYITKDSGERQEYENGFVRDTNKGKPRYELIPHETLKRVAELYGRGAEKYAADNWRQAEGKEAIERFKESAFRHFIQWTAGEEDEDHMAGAVFNLFAYEWHKKHKNKDKETDQDLLNNL